MGILKRVVLPVLLATVWISASEFVRNQFLLHNNWVKHYRGLGLTFPAQPVNGAMWGMWSLLFAIAIYVVSTRFSLWATFLYSWMIAFVMMWVVIGNLGVLPMSIMYAAIPLSMLETFIAVLIIKKTAGK